MGEARPVILFDGVCNLCNASVNYIIDHDPDAVFVFAALQSPEGRAKLIEAGQQVPEGDPDSIVLVEGARVSHASTAALRIARRLHGPVRWLWWLIVVPRPIRDAVYRFIARHRYRWFGRQQACRVPTPELRGRFL